MVTVVNMVNTVDVAEMRWNRSDNTILGSGETFVSSG